ncbi:hypothetical protein Emed_005586 [Eimeria media]
MAASQELEGDHSLELHSNQGGPPLSTVRSRFHFKKKSTSLQFDGLFPKQRNVQKALGASGVLTALLASLALIYMMLTCLRHVSGAGEVSGHRLRFLASGSPPDDDREPCLASLAEEEQEQEQEQEQGEEEEGAGAQEGAAAAPTPTVARQPSWRNLPPVIEQELRETLVLLEEPLVIMRRLLPLLSPAHTMSTTWVLGRLLCLEMSAFALAPTSLEPLKTQVARAYCSFIQEVLTTADVVRQANVRMWAVELRVLQVMIWNLKATPKAPQRLAATTYISFIVIQRQLCRLQYCMILQLLERVEAIKLVDPTFESDDIVFFNLQPLNELYRTRLTQIVHRATSRFWLSFQQTKMYPSYFFDAETEKMAREAHLGTVRAQRKAIVSAVWNHTRPAGSQLTPSTLAFSQELSDILFQQQELQQQQQELQQQQQQQEFQQQQQTSGVAGLRLTQLSADAEPFQMPHVQALESEQLQTGFYEHHYPSSSSYRLTQQDIGLSAATPEPLTSESLFSWMYAGDVPFPVAESSGQSLPRSRFAPSSASPDDASTSSASAGGQPLSVSVASEATAAAERTEQQFASDRGAVRADLDEDEEAEELLQLIQQTVNMGLFSEDQETGNE